MSCKICIIGAGSGIFSLNLIKDICVNPIFRNCTVSLMDVDEKRLDAIYGLCLRYSDEMNASIQVQKTTNRREAMIGADFVLNVALDYGHERYKQGIDVAYAHGYRYGGSLHVLHDEAFYINFYQLRLMESIYQDVLRICPNAWYVLVANPVQAGITYLKRKYPDGKIVGMCHGSNGVYNLAEAMGLDRNDISFEVSGVNHFIWLTSFRYKGEDAFPLLDRWIAEEYPTFCETIDDSHLIGPKAVDLYKRYGVFPIGDTSNPGGGAWGWEYHSDDETQKLYKEDPLNWYRGYFKRGAQRVEAIREAVENPQIKVSELFTKLPSGEPMVPLMEGLYFDAGNKVMVNILNDGGYMKGLPKDYEVEIAAIVDKHGIHPIHNNGLPRPIMAHLVRDRIAPVEMELAAFENQSREYLVDLIMMDPWTRSRAQAEGLIDAIFALPCNEEMKEFYH